MQHEEKHTLTPFGLYIAVWATLVFLTFVTVGVSYLDMRNAAIILAVMIATVKVLLVLLYFMHVRFDKPIIRKMLVAATVVYGIFFALTMSDYFYR